MSSTEALQESIRVVAYSGYRAEQEPRAVIVGGRRLEVTRIEERWYDPAARYFRVRTSDGGAWLLRYDLESRDWSRVATAGAVTKKLPCP